MSRQHRDWFRSGPVFENEETDVRAERMLASIEHRLNEIENRDGKYPPVFLYVHARNEGAFLLGRKARNHQRQEQDRNTPVGSGSASRLFLDFQIRAYSPSKSDKEGSIYTLDLSKVHPRDVSRNDAVDRSLHTEIHSLTTPEQEPIPRSNLALIVYVGDISDGWKNFRDRALDAAEAGAVIHGYRATENDRCDNALFIRIDAKEFYDSARSGSAEPFARELLEELERASKNIYGMSDVPVRLFMQGPSIISYAAGTFLPHGSKYVPFDSKLAPSTNPEQGRIPDTELVAIVDGDDVGSETERHLLSGDLEKAIGHSKRITDSINHMVTEINHVPGIEVISQGGDSAMFSLSSKQVVTLNATLDDLRTTTNFKVSCGYGRDSKESFLALRLAKSSGKNITLGYDQQ